MKKSITLSLLLTITFSVNNQKIGDNKAVRVAVQNFFKGFHKWDDAFAEKVKLTDDYFEKK